MVNNPNLFVGVSGGRTSMLMAKMIFDHFSDKFNIVFSFQNTSREKEETLIFLDNASKIWGLPIVWLEAVINPEKGGGTTHRVVTFETALRKGELFEELIKKYGIPNGVFKHCTRELKSAPARSYAKELWSGENYITAIGYRADEPRRAKPEKAAKLNQWYPMAEWGFRKADVAYFFNRNTFDLGLLDAEGNCKVCFKKADAKILYQISTDPDCTIFIRAMEQKYAMHKAGRDNPEYPPPYTFFRGGRTLDEVIADYPEFDPKSLADASLDETGVNFDLWEQDECGDSCEPFSE